MRKEMAQKENDVLTISIHTCFKLAFFHICVHLSHTPSFVMLKLLLAALCLFLKVV